MAFPDWLEPMAATLTADRFTDPAWTFERKLDGIRVLAFKRGARVELWSRNRLSLTAAYPAVAQALAALPHDTLILDGEATGGWGRQGKADYNVFDVLWIDGRDVRPLPLDERRAILKTLPLELPVARVTPLTGDAPWERACREGWEGVIAKRRDSPYEGKRSKAWLKMKCEASQELVVGGFTDPQRSRVGLGALLVGYFDGDDFVFAGKIGTGFDNALLRDLRARLDALERKTTPFTRATGLPKLRVHWVTPEIVVQAAFTEWTGGGKLRHPRLLGVRDRQGRARGGPRARMTHERSKTAVAITHPEKVLFPDDGITKARGRRLLRRRRRGDAAARPPPAGDDGALSVRHRPQGLPAEERRQGLPRVAGARRAAEEGRHRALSARQRRALAPVDGQPEHGHAARVDVADAGRAAARHLRLRSRSGARTIPSRCGPRRSDSATCSTSAGCRPR